MPAKQSGNLMRWFWWCFKAGAVVLLSSLLTWLLVSVHTPQLWIDSFEAQNVVPTDGRSSYNVLHFNFKVKNRNLIRAFDYEVLAPYVTYETSDAEPTFVGTDYAGYKPVPHYQGFGKTIHWDLIFDRDNSFELDRTTAELMKSQKSYLKVKLLMEFRYGFFTSKSNTLHVYLYETQVYLDDKFTAKGVPLNLSKDMTAALNLKTSYVV